MHTCACTHMHMHAYAYACTGRQHAYYTFTPAELESRDAPRETEAATPREIAAHTASNSAAPPPFIESVTRAALRL